MVGSVIWCVAARQLPPETGLAGFQAIALLLPTFARVAGLSSALALVVGNLGARHGGEAQVKLMAWDAWGDARSGAPPSDSRLSCLLGLAVGAETAAASATVRAAGEEARRWETGGRWLVRSEAAGARGSGGADDAHETHRQQGRQ
jgi:hypothetical protein